MCWQTKFIMRIKNGSRWLVRRAKLQRGSSQAMMTHTCACKRISQLPMRTFQIGEERGLPCIEIPQTGHEAAFAGLPFLLRFTESVWLQGTLTSRRCRVCCAGLFRSDAMHHGEKSTVLGRLTGIQKAQGFDAWRMSEMVSEQEHNNPAS